MSEVSKQISDIFLSSIFSLILSIWVIPYFIIRKVRKKRQLIIALALGDIIKQINTLIDSSNIAQIDKSEHTFINIKTKKGEEFLGLFLAFNSELFKAKNQYLFLSKKNQNHYTFNQLIGLYEEEYSKLTILQKSLQNILNEYVEFISDNLITNIADLINLINNIQHEIYSLKKMKDNAIEIGLDIEKPQLPTNDLNHVYERIFDLQGLLMKDSRYFILEEHTN